MKKLIIVLTGIFAFSCSEDKSSKKILSLFPSPGSKYAQIGTLEGPMPFSKSLQVSFSLADSTMAEHALKDLKEMGWESLEILANEKRDSLTIYPTGQSRFGLSGNIISLKEGDFHARQGYLNYYSENSNAEVGATKQANEEIDKFSKDYKVPVLFRKIVSVMNFPGEKNMWQVKFCAAYNESN